MADARKLSAFIGARHVRKDGYYSTRIKHPLLLAGNIFTHGSSKSYIDRVFDMWMHTRCPGDLEYFSYLTIDGDCFGAALGVNFQGGAETFGADSSYVANCDEAKTEAAFRAALNAQFSRNGEYIDNDV